MAATTKLPNATVGQPYSLPGPLEVTGSGTHSYSWAFSPTCTPPSWLNVAPIGVLSGTPQTPGVFEFTLRATHNSTNVYKDPSYSQDLKFSLEVVGNPANARYVATTGSDTTGNGSSTQPWATIQYAVNHVSAGQSIIVKPGTYKGCRILTSGTALQPMTLSAESAGVVIKYQPTGGTRNAIIEVGGNTNRSAYWTIEGFDVDAGVFGQVVSCVGISAVNTDHLTIRRCNVHHGLDYHAMSAHGVRLEASTNATVDRNTVSGCWGGIWLEGASDSCVVSNNTIINSGHTGISLWSGSDSDGSTPTGTKVVANAVYAEGRGTCACGISANSACHSTMVNNLVYGSKAYGISLGNSSLSATGACWDVLYNNTLSAAYAAVALGGATGHLAAENDTVVNNVLYSATGLSIRLWPNACATFKSDYNAVVNSFSVDGGATTIPLSSWQSRSYDAHSVSVSTADFADYASNNFHLRDCTASVPAPEFDHGTNTSAPAAAGTDKDGVIRPQGGAWDIGCYEKQVPLYVESSDNSTSLTSSTTWQDKLTKPICFDIDARWWILAFAEYSAAPSAQPASVQLTVDGNTVATASTGIRVSGDYYPFAAQTAVMTLSKAPAVHTIKLQYHTTSGGTAYIRRARIVAIRPGGAGLEGTGQAGGRQLSSSPTNCLVLPTSYPWTSQQGGTFLVVFSGEVSTVTTAWAHVRPVLNGQIQQDIVVRSPGAGDYMSFMTYAICSAPASVQQTANIAAYSNVSSSAWIRNARITVVQLTGARFNDFVQYYLPSDTSTTLTSWQPSLSETWTWGVRGKWLLLTSATLAGVPHNLTCNVHAQTGIYLSLNDTMPKYDDWVGWQARQYPVLNSVTSDYQRPIYTGLAAASLPDPSSPYANTVFLQRNVLTSFGVGNTPGVSARMDDANFVGLPLDQ